MAFVRYQLISAVLYVCFEKRLAIVEQFKKNKNEHGPKSMKEHLKKLGFVSLETHIWYVKLLQKESVSYICTELEARERLWDNIKSMLRKAV